MAALAPALYLDQPFGIVMLGLTGTQVMQLAGEENLVTRILFLADSLTNEPIIATVEGGT